MSIAEQRITFCKSQMQKIKSRPCLFLVPLVLIFYFPAIAGLAAGPSPLKEITVVSDDNYPPYIFRDQEGHLQGILVDEWRLWEEKTGIKAHLRGMDWGKAQKTMAEGNAQVIDTIFFTEERAKTLAFSTPYASLDVPIFFHEEISGIKDVKSLQGFMIGVKAGDACIDYLKKRGIRTLREYLSYESIVRDAAEQKIKVFCMDAPPAQYYLYKMNLAEQYRHTAPLYTGQFHRAVHKERKDLLKTVEEGFAKISRNEYGQIEKRWCGSPIALSHYLKYLFYLMGVFSVLGVALLLWNHSLRQRVTQKTVQLQKAVDALEKSEDKYRNLFEYANEAIFVAQDGKLVFLNPMTTMISGYSGDELMAKPFIEFIHPDDRDMVIANHLRRLNGEGVPHRYSFRIIHKDGNIRWAELSAVLINWNGNPATLNFMVEITDRKRAEEELKQSEERYRTILDEIEEGYQEVDLSGNFTFCNESFCKIFGYGMTELLGSNFRQYASDKETADRVYQAYNQMYKTGNPLKRFEWDIITKSGFRRSIEFSASLLRDREGHRRGFRGIVRDVTDRKLAEDQYRIMANSSQTGVYIAQGGRLCFVNPQIPAYSGYSEEELLGSRILNYVYPDDREFVKNQARRMLRGEFSSPYEYRIVDSRGNVLWLMETVVLISYKGRQAVLGNTMNITEQKKAEEERARLRQQLVKAQKLEALGTLAGGIAHDFNNILMNIQGNASMMEADLEPASPDIEYLKSIEDSVRSAKNLTKQLLGLASIGRFEVKTLNMNDVVEKTATLFGRTKKEIVIHRKYSKDLLSVEADRGQMEQVFMNLFVNAWQAMPGGGELFLETGNVSLDERDVKPYDAVPGQYVKISVTDTGIGMDEKTRGRIFDPFFTTKEMGRGTGLGLSMTYGIIRGHQGVINVYSEPGQGTTFSVYLPASKEEAVPDVSISSSVIGGSGLILLVDDEAQVLKVSQLMLEHLGYKVVAARNGKEAVSLYQDRKDEIDLVLLDMIMPDISGEKVFQILREINSGVRVILLSGYSIEGQAQKILDEGCDGFLQKPVSLSELSQKIHEVLQLKKEGYT